MPRPTCVEDVIRAGGELYDSIEHVKRGVASCRGRGSSGVTIRSEAKIYLP
jgi:hypothetical protein